MALVELMIWALTLARFSNIQNVSFEFIAIAVSMFPTLLMSVLERLLASACA